MYGHVVIAPLREQTSSLLVTKHAAITDSFLACYMNSNYAPTAQVASQQGKYLARVFNQLAKKEELELALEEARHSQGQPIDME